MNTEEVLRAIATLRAPAMPGEYDLQKTRLALSKTLNITAYDGAALIGCLRILTDGHP